MAPSSAAWHSRSTNATLSISSYFAISSILKKLHSQTKIVKDECRKTSSLYFLCRAAFCLIERHKICYQQPCLHIKTRYLPIKGPYFLQCALTTHHIIVTFSIDCYRETDSILFVILCLLHYLCPYKFVIVLVIKVIYHVSSYI